MIIDSISGEPLPLATIETLKGRKKKLLADENGQILIPASLIGKDFSVSFTGYGNEHFTASDKDTLQLVLMSPVSFELEEIVVKPKKEKYSKKNNPAVDFVNHLRKAAVKNNPADSPFYSYDKYEKTLIAVNNFKGNFDKGFLSKRTKFLEDYVDTSQWTGARLLDIMLKEKSSTQIKSLDPKADKEIIHGYRSVGVDEVLDQQNVQVVLEDVIREVDIYSPSINILQNRFVSPLSPIGPDFYKYYLTDTVYIGEDRCIELSFIPKNAQSMGFNGKLYVIEGDTNMFVKKVTMRTPHDMNVNFLRNLYINQSFERDSVGNRHKSYDDVLVEMQIIAGTPEFYGRKTSLYDNFSYLKREDLKHYYGKLGSSFRLTDSIPITPEFWNEKRMIPLSPAESRMGDFTSKMRKVPFLYWTEKVIGLLESGYVMTGKPSKFDFGPLNTFLSFGGRDGVRLRVGGMTTAAFNPHVFLKGYVAYGTKDRKWKYSGEIEYSFFKKERFASEWPRHGIYGLYSYDRDQLGQQYMYTSQDNFFLSLKRKYLNLSTYRKLARGGYVLELPNNLSIEAGVKYVYQEPTPDIPFMFHDGRVIGHYEQGSFNVVLRWAKGEKFVQGRSHRLPVNMDPWIITFRHEYGPKGLFGSYFTTNRTEISVNKRFWLSAFGYMDVVAKAGKVWSSVYFPALMWPNANLSYTIQPESYSLMDPMEFANDAYAALDFTYFGNGILFNRIPGINKLRLREAVTFKGLMGTLSDRNNPRLNGDLLTFPSDAIAMKMKKTPYMEIGVGIDNILSVLRVDYVWRLTYRDNPGVDRSGVRVSFHFTL
ncbi:MAG: carboxypeptidase-like regulatory domain-containing protein [Muribaculaceae bacterium]|nr:carboxypeptidase-like regulatory domain-containing protein [Muribaculaceae bacterium]